MLFGDNKPFGLTSLAPSVLNKELISIKLSCGPLLV